MRILVYAINFPPELIGTAPFTGEMVAWLARQGHDVRVIASQPYYPDWRVMPGYHAARYSRDAWEATTVWRCPVWVPRRPSGVKRMLHYFTLALSSAPVALRQIVAPPMMSAPVALIVSKLSRGRSWLHVQDFEVAAAGKTGLLRSPFLHRLASFVERRILHWFDRVSTISARMLDGLGARGVAGERCVFFRNWVDVKAIYPLADSASFRKELGISSGAVVVLYSGAMSAKQGLATLLEAARLLENDDSLRLVVCGNGGEREKLEREYSGLRNVAWLPLHPFSRFNELLNVADLHVLLQIAGVADLVMPSKLSGMPARGRPVVVTAAEGTQVAEVVARYRASRRRDRARNGYPDAERRSKETEEPRRGGAGRRSRESRGRARPSRVRASLDRLLRGARRRARSRRRGQVTVRVAGQQRAKR